MDRYLFRGKQLDNGKWIKGYLIEKWWYGSNSFYILEGIFGGDEIGEEIDESTIGQCTGLKDKGGKLIFEGDLLKSEDRIVMVSWLEENAQFDCKFVKHCGDKTISNFKGINPRDFKYLEIIGNIHDNPELLQSA